MKRLYLDLRGLMTSQDVTIKQLARGVGVSTAHINDILAQRTYPKIDLCYDILAFLDADKSKVFKYFPPKGERIEEPIVFTNPRAQTVTRVGRMAAGQ